MIINRQGKKQQEVQFVLLYKVKRLTSKVFPYTSMHIGNTGAPFFLAEGSATCI